MQHMKFESPDLVQGNIEKIEALFPNCVTETRGEDGKLKKAVNFDLLRQMLSGEVAEGDEAYEFTWVGKKAAIVEANKPIRKTLRPCPEESVNWDTTENLYIEGDNLEVLKLLQESYLGKVKMIYIDPPYNTGHDFVYRDDYSIPEDEYEDALGLYNDDGEKLFLNTESNGRFHSDWCSMIYSRLLLARNLLRDNGVIFISIDGNEAASLEKICDEIFGRKNFIANVTVVNNFKGRSDDKYIATAHEQMLIYQRGNFVSLGVEVPEEYVQEYKLTDNKGKYRLQGLRKRGTGSRREDRPNMYYPFYYNPKTEKLSLRECDGSIAIYPKLSDESEGRWRWGKETSESKIDELTAQLVQGRNEYDVFQKDYLPDDGSKRSKPKSFWHKSEFSAEAGTLQVKSLLGKGVFETPKSTELLKYCIEQSASGEDIILDFFSGSGSLAHAVMEINSQDNGNRKFILVQLPEKCDETSIAYKAGYKNICEIGKERIRRAGKKIKDDSPLTTQNLDIGFRVLKLADSNMNDVYYSAGEYGQQKLDDMESKIKPDRTDLDLLFGCLLEWGLPLSLPYKSETIDGCTVHTYAPGDPDLEIRDALIACFDEKVPTNVIEAIARRNPLRAVFREECFTSSPDKINVYETFKRLAQGTAVKVI